MWVVREMLRRELLPSSSLEMMPIETEVQHVFDFDGGLNCQNRCRSDPSRTEWINDIAQGQTPGGRPRSIAL
jgi:hypothetical protein